MNNKSIDELPTEVLSIIKSYLNQNDLKSFRQTSKKMSKIPTMSCSDCETSPEKCMSYKHLGCIKDILRKDQSKLYYIIDMFIQTNNNVIDLLEWFKLEFELNKDNLSELAIISAHHLDSKLLEWTLKNNLYKYMTDDQSDKLLHFLIVISFYQGVENSIDYLLTMAIPKFMIGEVADNCLSKYEVDILNMNNITSPSDVGEALEKEENELNDLFWYKYYENIWRNSLK